MAWAYGLVGTFIGGGAGAAGSALGGILIDPKQFNLDEPAKLLKLAAVTFLFTGISGALTYLAKSPLPPVVEEQTVPPFKPEPRA